MQNVTFISEQNSVYYPRYGEYKRKDGVVGGKGVVGPVVRRDDRGGGAGMENKTQNLNKKNQNVNKNNNIDISSHPFSQSTSPSPSNFSPNASEMVSLLTSSDALLPLFNPNTNMESLVSYNMSMNSTQSNAAIGQLNDSLWAMTQYVVTDALKEVWNHNSIPVVNREQYRRSGQEILTVYTYCCGCIIQPYHFDINTSTFLPFFKHKKGGFGHKKAAENYIQNLNLQNDVTANNNSSTNPSNRFKPGSSVVQSGSAVLGGKNQNNHNYPNYSTINSRHNLPPNHHNNVNRNLVAVIDPHVSIDSPIICMMPGDHCNVSHGSLKSESTPPTQKTLYDPIPLSLQLKYHINIDHVDLYEHQVEPFVKTYLVQLQHYYTSIKTPNLKILPPLGFTTAATRAAAMKNSLNRERFTDKFSVDRFLPHLSLSLGNNQLNKGDIDSTGGDSGRNDDRDGLGRALGGVQIIDEEVISGDGGSDDDNDDDNDNDNDDDVGGNDNIGVDGNNQGHVVINIDQKNQKAKPHGILTNANAPTSINPVFAAKQNRKQRKEFKSDGKKNMIGRNNQTKPIFGPSSLTTITSSKSTTQPPSSSTRMVTNGDDINPSANKMGDVISKRSDLLAFVRLGMSQDELIELTNFNERLELVDNNVKTDIHAQPMQLEKKEKTESNTNNPKLVQNKSTENKSQNVPPSYPFESVFSLFQCSNPEHNCQCGLGVAKIEPKTQTTAAKVGLITQTDLGKTEPQTQPSFGRLRTESLHTVIESVNDDNNEEFGNGNSQNDDISSQNNKSASPNSTNHVSSQNQQDSRLFTSQKITSETTPVKDQIGSIGIDNINSIGVHCCHPIARNVIIDYDNDYCLLTDPSTLISIVLDYLAPERSNVYENIDKFIDNEKSRFGVDTVDE
jgi:hypothetical protein